MDSRGLFDIALVVVAGLLAYTGRRLSNIAFEGGEVPLLRLLAIVALTNVGSIVASVLFVAYLLPLYLPQKDARTNNAEHRSIFSPHGTFRLWPISTRRSSRTSTSTTSRTAEGVQERLQRMNDMYDSELVTRSTSDPQRVRAVLR